MGPKSPSAGTLSPKDETIILAYRWRTRLALDDAHFELRRLMPNLSRSTLYRCLKRRGFSRIGQTAPRPPLTSAALKGPYIFEITVHHVVFHDHDDDIGVVYQVFLAVEEITKDVYAEVTADTPDNAAAFLGRLVAESSEKIIAVTTGMLPVFTDGVGTLDEDMAAVSRHPFAVTCRAHRIAHARSPPPRTKPPKIRSRGVEIR